jgi:hypothetical protein
MLGASFVAGFAAFATFWLRRPRHQNPSQIRQPAFEQSHKVCEGKSVL